MEKYIIIFFGLHSLGCFLVLLACGFKREKKIEKVDYFVKWRR